MKVSEESFCIDLFRQNPVFTSLHLRSPVHVVPPQEVGIYALCGMPRYQESNKKEVVFS
jgi:hypothetical protein